MPVMGVTLQEACASAPVTFYPERPSPTPLPGKALLILQASAHMPPLPGSLPRFPPLLRLGSSGVPQSCPSLIIAPRTRDFNSWLLCPFLPSAGSVSQTGDDAGPTDWPLTPQPSNGQDTQRGLRARLLTGTMCSVGVSHPCLFPSLGKKEGSFKVPEGLSWKGC